MYVKTWPLKAQPTAESNTSQITLTSPGKGPPFAAPSSFDGMASISFISSINMRYY